MRAVAAVFAREVFERRFAFVVALAAGLVPLVGSLVYGWRSHDAAEGRVLVALVGATALSAAFAILLGAAVIVGDTREKRISFYFSRPIPSASLWAGKLLAAVAITLATAVLAFAPGWLSGSPQARSLWGFDATPGNTALAALVLAVVLVLGSHAVVTVGRLRSPWVALDLLLAPTLVLLAAACLRSLLRNTGTDYFGARSPSERAVAALVALALLAVLLASLAQVSEGRTDARRSHGAFSVVLFGISGLAVSLLGGYTWWCVTANATDLAAVTDGIQPAPRGPWFAAGGPLTAERGSGNFLFEPASGRSIRVRSWGVAFSQDGRRAVWGEGRFGFFERTKQADIVLADLVAGRAVRTGLECESPWSDLVLSPDGTRLAVRDEKAVVAFDVSNPENPKQLAVFPQTSRSFAFVDDDTLRLFPRAYNARTQKLAATDLEITELSLRSKRSLVTGRFDRETLPFLFLSPDARFLVGARSLSDDPNGVRALTLHDGRTGLLLATLADNLRNAHLRFLSAGGFVVAGIGDSAARLIFFASEKTLAAPSRTVDLGPAARVVLGRGEFAPGRLVVALNSSKRNDEAMRRSWKMYSVDTAGSVAPLAEDLTPAFWPGTRVLWPAETRSPAALLFLDASSRLVRLDPATGARTVVLGKGK